MNDQVKKPLESPVKIENSKGVIDEPETRNPEQVVPETEAGGGENASDDLPATPAVSSNTVPGISSITLKG